VNLLLLEPGERDLSARDPRARHIRKVLRLTIGDSLRAGEVHGRLGTATIVSESSGRLVLEFEPMSAPPPLAPVELLLGHPRPIVLRRLLRDLSALGPASIVVTHTDLGERSYYESNLWDDVRTPLLEGAAQGGSTLVPALTRMDSLQDAVAQLVSPTGRRFILHEASDAAADGTRDAERVSETETAPALARLLSTPADRGVGVTAATAEGRTSASGSAADPPARVAVAVGSERGWTEREVRLLESTGFRRCSLGRRILRTETASTIAVWAAISWCENRL
jgi:16S rRNA U1498 N3-methylase RsmE